MPPRVHAAQPHAQRDTQRAEQLEVAEVVGQELDEALVLGFFNIDIDIYTVNVNTKYSDIYTSCLHHMKLVCLSTKPH